MTRVSPFLNLVQQVVAGDDAIDLQPFSPRTDRLGPYPEGVR